MFRLFPHSLLLALLLAANPALLAQPAGTASHDAPQRPLKEWQKTLDETEKELTQAEVDDPRLIELRENLLTLEQTLRLARDAANEDLAVVRHDLEALGTPPGEGAPAEAPSLAERRKRLNEQSAATEGFAKESELLSGRIARSMDTIKQRRRTQFARRILTRIPSPLSTTVWAKAAPEWQAIWASCAASVQSWLARPEVEHDSRTMGQRFVIGVGLALLLAFPVRFWLARRLARLPASGPPTDLRRLYIAALTGLLNVWLPAMGVLALYGSLTLGTPLSAAAAELARDGVTASILVLITRSCCVAALRPKRPELRLAPLTDASARIVTRVVTTLALLFAMDFVLSTLLAQQDASIEVISTQTLVFGLLVALVLTSLLRPRVWSAPDQTPRLTPVTRRLRALLILLIAAIPLSAVAGYIALSHLLVTHWVVTVGLLALFALLVRVNEELVSQLVDIESRTGLYLRRQLALTEEGAEMLGFWLLAMLKLGLAMATGLALLMLWSVDRKDTWLWLEEGFRGFKLGGIQVAPAEILAGLLLFAVLLTVTRLIQRALDRRIFPRTRLDAGLRHSIRSAVGYAGIALALMLGISAMGIDLSSLAIIAGALTVGIGFGLQNIVNNFVSGLILLIERPIKAGDWVVVGEHQGYVRQISVRATEISTFDRASVFIPNSSLISGAVMNRTYADKIGRVLLPVGISYDADPAKAREILLEIAMANPDIRHNPAPAVMMLGFGDSALNLELVAFLHDVDRVKVVTSDLCFAIHAAFRQHGIPIPYPQREVRVSLDREWLRHSFAQGGPPASQ